jgi:hypothetical protein
MSSLKTPDECGKLAEEALADYAHACGAFGDQVAIPKILEMMISKCSLAIAEFAGEERAHSVLLRTSLNVSKIRSKGATQ